MLTKHENHELYFGEASVLLHNVLLNDPKPYRKEVKELLGNLLRWIEILKYEEICVDRPKHSQRIRLIKSENYNKILFDFSQKEKYNNS